MLYAFLRLLIQASFVVCLAGCLSDNVEFEPHKGRSHRVVFTIDPLPVNGGGLVLWGKSDTGDSFGQVVNGNTTTVDMHSGNWTFYGMAWAGEVGDENGNTIVGDPVAGVISCAIQPKVLSGDGKIEVKISTFDTANCNNTAFAPGTMVTGASTDYRIGTVTMNFCESVNDISAVTDTCSDDLTLGASRKSGRGHAMSYRVNVVSYYKDKKGLTKSGTKVSSGCLFHANAGDPLNGQVFNSLQQIPAGNGSDSPFYLEVETFPGNYYCNDSTHGSRLVDFPNGLIKTTGNARHLADGNIHRVFVKMAGDEICKDKSLTQNFAGGDGAQVQPFLVCNPEQLYNVIPQGLNASHFKLLQDIDLTPYHKGHSGSRALPSLVTSSTCLADGSNFYPIGMHAGCSAPNTAVPADARSGDFDGGDKTIKGLRILMNSTSPDMVGFMSLVSGPIRRLKFENAKVTGINEVGIVAGRHRSTINFVEISDSSITGTLKVGGVVGQMNGPSTENVKISKIQMKGSNQVGSLFGSVDSTVRLTGNKIYSSGEIRGGNNTGGLVGNVNFGFGIDLEEVRFEGYVAGDVYVGGLLGAAGTVRLVRSYVNAGINSTSTVNTPGVGGLIGFLNGAQNTHVIANAYFYGTIRHRCTNGNGCRIGNTFGVYDVASWDATPPSDVYFSIPRLTGTEASGFIGVGYTPASFITTATAFPAAFLEHDGDIPRLAGEVSWHPCRQNSAYETVALQVSTLNRGTASNPILICNGDQVDRFATYLSSHFKLANYVYDFNLRTVPAPTSNFSGVVEGDNFGLHGSSYNWGAGSTAGLNSNSGTWKNLSFYNTKVLQVGAGSGSIIAYTNTGTFTDMKFLGLDWTADSGGTIVRDNDAGGVIRNVEIQGYMVPFANMGGVAQVNSGTIDGLTLNLTMKSVAAASSVSGIVKENRSGGVISNAELNVNLETLGDASTYQSLVTNYNHAGGIIKNIHLRSGTLKGSGAGAHLIAAKNDGTISQVVNEAFAFIKSDVAVPPIAPTPLQNESLVTSTVGNNAGTIDDIFYFNEARWIFEHQQRFGVYNAAFGMAPAQDGMGNCIVDTTPASVPRIQNVPVWNAFIGPAGAAGAGRLFFSPTEFGNLDHEVLSTFASRTGSYDSWKLFDNDCSTVVQSSNTWLVYLPGDPNGLIGLSSATKTVWSPWHADLAASVSVIDLGSSSDAGSLNEYEFKSKLGLSATKPTWIFTPGTGIRLYGR